MNPWETIRGVDFMDLVPRALNSIAEELKMHNDLQREHNELLRRQTEALEKIVGNDGVLLCACDTAYEIGRQVKAE